MAHRRKGRAGQGFIQSGRSEEDEFQRPVKRNHGTELSQYSRGLLALLFDKSCRNLSRGRFQTGYCRKPWFPPLCYQPCSSSYIQRKQQRHTLLRWARIDRHSRLNAHSIRFLCFPICKLACRALAFSMRWIWSILFYLLPRLRSIESVLKPQPVESWLQNRTIVFHYF